MSRIGNQIIETSSNIQVQVNEAEVVLTSGAKSLQIPLPENLEIKKEEGKLQVIRKSEDKKTRSLHGLTKALLQNAVTGLTKGWKKSLEMNGVGYKANLKGQKLELNLGFSHPIIYDIPKGVEIKVDKQTKLEISGIDRALVGLTAHQIKSYRPVEPYMAKGIKYSDEVVRRKAGKSAAGGGEKK